MKSLPLMKTVLFLLLSTVVTFGQSIEKNTEIMLTIRGVPQEDSTNFNGSYAVYGNGTINVPYLGNIQASGKTPDSLARHIESLYRTAEIYTNPTVNATYEQAIDEEEQKTITFRSQQGSKMIPYTKGMTLQEAIAAAGGAGTFDSKKRATLERNGKEYEYDMNNIQHRNVKIYPKDVIKLPHINSDSRLLRGIFGND